MKSCPAGAAVFSLANVVPRYYFVYIYAAQFCIVIVPNEVRKRTVSWSIPTVFTVIFIPWSTMAFSTY